MMIDPYERRERTIVDICRHESGHQVIARVLGFEAGDMEFKDLQAGSTFTGTAELNTVDEIVDWVSRRSIVLYAGAIAEAIEDGEIRSEYALCFYKNYVANDDYRKISEFVRLLRNIRGPVVALMKYRLNFLRSTDASPRACDLVEKYMCPILELTDVVRQVIPFRGKGIFSKEKIEALPFIKSLPVEII